MTNEITTALVTDAALDVPGVERSSSTWVVVPDSWTIGGETIFDYGERSTTLTRRAIRRPDVTVDAASIESITAAYEHLVSAGVTTIWSIHGASDLSPAIARARVAAVDFPEVRVVEVRAAGLGAGIVAARAHAMITAGVGVSNIDAFLERHLDDQHLLVVPDHFDPTASRRIIAERILAGYPMLSARQGTITRSKRLRSRRAAIQEIQSYVAAHIPDTGRVELAIGHAGAAGAVDPFLDIIERMRPEASVELVGRVGPRIVQRVGARCVGVSWIHEP